MEEINRPDERNFEKGPISELSSSPVSPAPVTSSRSTADLSAEDGAGLFSTNCNSSTPKLENKKSEAIFRDLENLKISLAQIQPEISGIDLIQVQANNNSSHNNGNNNKPSPSYPSLAEASILAMSASNANQDQRQQQRPRPIVPCIYANCGCQEMVTKGTLLEKVHYEHCEFRPLSCLIKPECPNVPFHDFILHHLEHHLQPTYSSVLTSRIILKKDDFAHDQRWSPKWLSAHGTHFFLNLWRKTPGIWSSWVYMFGQQYLPDMFLAKVIYYKGERYFGGTFPVHSIRMPHDEIEKVNGRCLLTSDDTFREVSQIGESLLADLSVCVQIVKNTGPPVAAPSPPEENCTASTDAATAPPVSPTTAHDEEINNYNDNDQHLSNEQVFILTPPPAPAMPDLVTSYGRLPQIPEEESALEDIDGIPEEEIALEDIDGIADEDEELLPSSNESVSESTSSATASASATSPAQIEEAVEQFKLLMDNLADST